MALNKFHLAQNEMDLPLMTFRAAAQTSKPSYIHVSAVPQGCVDVQPIRECLKTGHCLSPLELEPVVFEKHSWVAYGAQIRSELRVSVRPLRL
jgi:hypothetical protein